MSKFKNKKPFKPSYKQEEQSDTSNVETGYTTDKFYLNLREDMSSESEILEELEPHTKILIFDYFGEWAEVELAETHVKGFVKKEYITIAE